MSSEQRCVKCAGPSGGLPYCPTCDPANPDTPTAPEPAAAPQVDSLRNIAAWFDLEGMTANAEFVRAAADELDTHHARRAELVALLAEWRAYACDGNTCPDADRATTYCADALARILGEQP